MIRPPKSILIININLIGDVILSTPLVGLLAEAFPGVVIDFLANRGTGELLEKDPRIRRVIYSDGNEVGSSGKNSSYLKGIFRSYDMAVGMSASDRINVAVIAAGRTTRVGFYKAGNPLKNLWQRLMLTHPLESSENTLVARNCSIVADALGIRHDRLNVRIFWDDEDDDRVRDVLEKQGLRGQPYFVVHPIARWAYKYWKFENFAAVSDYVFEQYGLQPVWTSSPSDEEKEQLQKAIGLCRHKPLTVAGDFNLNQMAGLLKRADLYLGLDTAITHVAASTGVPVVALYGPTFTTRWFPYDNQGPHDQQSPAARGILRHGKIVVVQKDLECVPCGRAGCDDNRNVSGPCLQEISVDDVLSAVNVCMTADSPMNV
ncbi:MAG TPA: glycosyltransferase family 9 protein [Desulfuromonadales bacterium]|nr:glycosyltransferase family 9 protein [Desulfuromonadales bacterium]